MNTGQKVKAYCKKNGIPIQSFASACGLSHMAIYYWASGKRSPSVKCLLKLEAATGIPASKWLEDKAA